jgi:predicted metal-dependent phosphoesterase TrpH
LSPRLIRVGLHLHSRFSPDSITPLERIVERARELGLERIGLTDHETAEGALELKRREPLLTIVGQETKTTEGEVIGLFIDRTIEAYRPPEEVLDEIHALGGVTYLAHPLDRRRYRFAPHRVAELAPRVDVIEVHNQWSDADANRAAAELARELGIPGACGSDAHAPPELGHCWLEMEEFGDAAGFLAALPGARLVISAPAARARA